MESDIARPDPLTTISKLSGHSHDIRIVIAGSAGALAFGAEREELGKIITQII